MKRLPFLLVPIALAPPAVLFAQEPPKVTSIAVQPGVEVELEFTDTTIGGVRYTLEASEGLFGWSEIASGLPNILDTSRYALNSPIGEGETRKFFQIRSEPAAATLGFESSALEVDEGSGAQQVAVRFVDESGAPLIYNGPLSYRWSGATALVGSLTGTVMAGGTGTVIPLDILDNTETESLRQLTLTLMADGSGNYEVNPAAAASTVTILENDNFWRGGFVSESGILGLEFYVQRDSGLLTISLTDGTELLPEGGLSIGTAATLSDTVFHVEFPGTDVLSTAENLVAAGTRLELVLDADSSIAGQTVSSDELAGTGTLTLRNLTKPHLDTTITGTFVVRQDPPLQPDDDLILE